MKMTDKDKPIRTMPEGVWESSNPADENKQRGQAAEAETAADAQGGELPIGFTMELAMHTDALNHFSALSDSEKEAVIEGAREVNSREEMRNYVESIFKL